MLEAGRNTKILPLAIGTYMTGTCTTDGEKVRGPIVDFEPGGDVAVVDCELYNLGHGSNASRRRCAIADLSRAMPAAQCAYFERVASALTGLLGIDGEDARRAIEVVCADVVLDAASERDPEGSARDVARGIVEDCIASRVPGVDTRPREKDCHRPDAMRGDAR